MIYCSPKTTVYKTNIEEQGGGGVEGKSKARIF